MQPSALLQQSWHLLRSCEFQSDTVVNRNCIAANTDAHLGNRV